jgi:alpha 1,3-glucosidase
MSEKRSKRSYRPPATPLLFLSFFLIVTLLPSSLAVKRHDFKTCDQSGFCKRNRALADRAAEAGSSWQSPYELKNASFSSGRLSAAVSNALFPQIQYSFEVRFQEDGNARIVMDEVNGLRQRYNEASKWAFETEPTVDVRDSSYEVDITDKQSSVKYAGGRQEVRIQHKPVLVTFLRDGQPHLVLNERGLFNMEHFRVKQVGEQPDELVVQDPEHPEQQIVVVKDEAFAGFLPPNDDTMWEENFNGKRDSKPKGG